jgi:hypothetical protein
MRVVSDLRGLVAEGVKFGTVYADPPWSYSNQATRAGDRGVPTANSKQADRDRESADTHSR